MFSVFIVGRMFKRHRNIYNSLSFSAFILLLINPFIIYQVGFQLSYLAVFGIVFLQPKIYQLWSANNWLIDKAWEITCVSIAAQLATFPLGIYYFHQFPTLFLLSNFVVIPTAFLALILGILIITSAAMGLSVVKLIGALLNIVLWSMNEAVFFIENISFSVIDGLEFNMLQVILIYLCIVFFVALWLFKSFKYLVTAVILLTLVTLVEVGEAQARSKKKEVVFYDVRNNSVIDFRDGFNADFYIEESSAIQNAVKFIIGPDRLEKGLVHENIDIKSFKDWASPTDNIQVKVWNNIRFVRLNGKKWQGLEYDQVIETDYLIVSKDCVDSIEKLQEVFSFDLLIIDSSNSYYRSKTLTDEASRLNLNVHATGSNGALILEF